MALVNLYRFYRRDGRSIRRAITLVIEHHFRNQEYTNG